MNRTSRLVAMAHELEHVAEVGESDETPLILFAEVWLFCAIAVVVGIAIGLIAYRLA